MRRWAWQSGSRACSSRSATPHLGDGAVGDEAGERLVDLGDEVVEVGGNDGAGLSQRLVLGIGRLRSRVGQGASVAKLHLEREHLGTGTDAPCDDGLGDAAASYGRRDIVLIRAAHLAQQHHHLHTRIRLIPEQVIDEEGARVPVPTNGDALRHAIRGRRHDVVQLVAHAAGLGHVRHGSRAIQTAADDVVQHAARVADAEAAGCDAAHRRRADDGHTLLTRRLDQQPRLLLWHTLRNDGDDADRWLCQRLQRGRVDGAEGCEIDEDGRVGMLARGLVQRRVHGHHDLRGRMAREAAAVAHGEGGSGGGARRGRQRQ